VAYASADDVRALNGSTLGDTAIAPFLQAAGCVLDSLATCTASKNITADCLTTASAWLAAHLMAVSGVGADTRVKESERFENYTVKWAMSQSTGQGVKSTNYGQTANMLTMGCLAEADKSPAMICSFG
jgi:hypothetical protein